MLIYMTVTATNAALSSHCTLERARAFVREWKDLSGADRVVHRIVSVERDVDCIRGRTAKLRPEFVVETFALAEA
jgi:hypothetical protein